MRFQVVIQLEWGEKDTLKFGGENDNFKVGGCLSLQNHFQVIFLGIYTWVILGEHDLFRILICLNKTLIHIHTRYGDKPLTFLDVTVVVKMTILKLGVVYHYK